MTSAQIATSSRAALPHPRTHALHGRGRQSCGPQHEQQRQRNLVLDGERENIGVNSHIEPTSVQSGDDGVCVGVSVSAGGYSGGGAMTFVVDAERIARMVLTG